MPVKNTANNFNARILVVLIAILAFNPFSLSDFNSFLPVQDPVQTEMLDKTNGSLSTTISLDDVQEITSLGSDYDQFESAIFQEYCRKQDQAYSIAYKVQSSQIDTYKKPNIFKISKKLDQDSESIYFNSIHS